MNDRYSGNPKPAPPRQPMKPKAEARIQQAEKASPTPEDVARRIFKLASSDDDDTSVHRPDPNDLTAQSSPLKAGEEKPRRKRTRSRRKKRSETESNNSVNANRSGKSPEQSDSSKPSNDETVIRLR